MSCASCHNPSLGWSDGLPTAVGFDMQTLARATPTIVNTAFNTIQMWDGRKSTLEDQAIGPIEAAGEMNLPLPELVERLKSIPGYASKFENAYPGMGISEVTVARALASFERTVLSTESPFDRWRKGDEKAVCASAKRGFELFPDKAKCAVCHMGYNFTDNGFHNIGVKTDGAPDVGRFAQRPLKSMHGAFKTPTLRDIALTAPYMRNGAYKTLMEVVEHYDRGGDDKDQPRHQHGAAVAHGRREGRPGRLPRVAHRCPAGYPRAGSAPLTDSRFTRWTMTPRSFIRNSLEPPGRGRRLRDAGVRRRPDRRPGQEGVHRRRAQGESRRHRHVPQRR